MNVADEPPPMASKSSRARWLPWLLAGAALAGSVPALALSTVKVAPAAPHPTQAITVSGAGFGDGEAIDVYFDTVDAELVASSGTGTFNAALTVPAGATPGTHYITAVGRHSGDAAQFIVTVTTPWKEWGFGAAHLGWNPYENTLNTRNVDKLGLLWTAKTNGEGVGIASAPAVVNGILYTAGEGLGSSGGVQALKSATGEFLWRAETDEVFSNSPTVAEGTVYIGSSATNYLYALNAKTGARVWRHAIGGIGNPIGCSAAVVNGIVYVDSYDEKVYAINATTGEIIWTFKTRGPVFSTPAVVDGIVYVGSSDRNVYALNASTGAEYWAYETGGGIIASPTVSNGSVYIGSTDSNFYAIAAGANGGELLWSAASGGQIVSSAAAANGLIYVGSVDGNVYAFDAATGANHWAASTGAAVSASPIIANGVVYVGTGAGDFLALSATQGTVLQYAHGNGAILANAAVSDGVVYFSDIGTGGFDDVGNTYAYALLAGTGGGSPRVVNPPAPASLVPDMGLKARRQ